eukprot:GSMAST32.ASY1.ANO1.1637.1 assembled CDS
MENSPVDGIKSLSVHDVEVAGQQLSQVQLSVDDLPEGFARTELCKALAKVRRKIDKERVAIDAACSKESLVGKIKNSNLPLENEQHVFVFLLHELIVEAGFLCSGLVESVSQQRGTTSPSESKDTQEVSLSKSLPNGWSANSHVYGLQYMYGSSNKDIIVLKCLIVGDVISVHMMVQSCDSSVFSKDFNVSDYVCKAKSIRIAQIPNLRKIVETSLIEPLKCKLGVQRTNKTHSKAYKAELRNQTTNNMSNNDLLLQSGNQQRSTLVSEHFRRDVDPFFGAGIRPAGSFGGDFIGRGGGGMSVGPDHPIFGRDSARNGIGGPLPDGVPPGARFDPFGPGSRGHMGPSPDHLPPPGYGGGMGDMGYF